MIEDQRNNYDRAASYANSSASGQYSDGFHAATQAFATLALVDAVKELTQVMIDRFPEFE